MTTECVLALLREGKTDRAIMAVTGLSYNGVRYHVKKLLSLYRVPTRMHLLSRLLKTENRMTTVTVWLKDGTSEQIIIKPSPEIDVRPGRPRGPIEMAKLHIGEGRLREMEAKGIDRWEIEEEFL